MAATGVRTGDAGAKNSPAAELAGSFGKPYYYRHARQSQGAGSERAVFQPQQTHSLAPQLTVTLTCWLLISRGLLARGKEEAVHRVRVREGCICNSHRICPMRYFFF